MTTCLDRFKLVSNERWYIIASITVNYTIFVMIENFPIISHIHNIIMVSRCITNIVTFCFIIPITTHPSYSYLSKSTTTKLTKHIIDNVGRILTNLDQTKIVRNTSSNTTFIDDPTRLWSNTTTFKGSKIYILGVVQIEKIIHQCSMNNLHKLQTKINQMPHNFPTFHSLKIQKIKQLLFHLSHQQHHFQQNQIYQKQLN